MNVKINLLTLTHLVRPRSQDNIIFTSFSVNIPLPYPGGEFYDTLYNLIYYIMINILAHPQHY